MLEKILEAKKDLMASLSSNRVSYLGIYQELQANHSDWTRSKLEKETEKEYKTRLSFLKDDNKANKAELSKKMATMKKTAKKVITNKYVITFAVAMAMIALATVAGAMLGGLVLLALAFLVALGVINVKFIYGLIIVMVVGMMIYNAVEAIKMLQKSANWLHKV